MCVCVAGILNEDGSINNAPSIKRLAEVAVAYAKAGRIENLCSTRDYSLICGSVQDVT